MSVELDYNSPSVSFPVASVYAELTTRAIVSKFLIMSCLHCFQGLQPISKKGLNGVYNVNKSKSLRSGNH